MFETTRWFQPKLAAGGTEHQDRGRKSLVQGRALGLQFGVAGGPPLIRRFANRELNDGHGEATLPPTGSGRTARGDARSISMTSPGCSEEVASADITVASRVDPALS